MPNIVCSYCKEHFQHFEDAEEHELFYCSKSPKVNTEWDESPLNPLNKRCATCEHAESFLDCCGLYEVGPVTAECPQRYRLEKNRTFPCTAYVRATKAVGYDFTGATLTEVGLRYLRSFGIKARGSR